MIDYNTCYSGSNKVIYEITRRAANPELSGWKSQESFHGRIGISLKIIFVVNQKMGQGWVE